ncbi:4-hydroxymuconic semialdehyde dehydrogenase [Novosphingobium sp. Rr 2-17]|uniref:aldehyde dehydrogenase family protein n=1 Tax=Novosphingobium sp. Rr 2-17 TaxID=555793 RepID=UPI0002697ED7|nr:aldehyde dehydrogenase family protein [Novosphingobium sp. Rr 2-17]EIZ78348.1 4-hydroxymuconic semialdehyde dehydrogenase [Novosphingobium sp. Rr 2-17]
MALDDPHVIDRLQTKLLIDGQWVDGVAGTTIAVENPYDGSKIADVAEATAADVDLAVAAAQRAFPAWRALAGHERGRLLLKLADAIEADAANLARLESLDTGHPIRDCLSLDVPRTALCFRYFGGMADKIEGSVIPVDAGFLNYVEREPIGVVGAIVPWNFPLMFTSWKMGPALAAGNTVVIKPSEITPLSTLRIGELMLEVGIPAGVVNIVTGYGHTVGQRIAEHPQVGKVAFTGSTATGRKIVEASAGNLKKVQLELGGKGPNIIFADANIPAAIGGSAFAIFHNQGQACIAGSRLIVHESVVDQVLEQFVALTKSIKLGDPLDPETEMGPLTSRLHQQRVLDYVAVAKAQGAQVLAGGEAPEGAAFAKGCFVEPTIVRAKPGDRVATEEVFGPFVTVLTFKTDEEALAIANETDYGLGAGLWTQDITRAHRFAKQIHAGMVWVNCYKRVHPASPFGGVGMSGYGREMGFEAMREYTQAKSVWINVDAKIPPFYRR